jgi:predicted phage-related endonuclease
VHVPRLTDAQLTERRLGIGSSDIAALICGGKGGVGDPWGVWNEKHGIGEREEESVEMWLGHEAEALMVRLYERETGHRVRPGNTVKHPHLPWAFATIDGEIDRRETHVFNPLVPAVNRYVALNRALECKLVGAHRMPDWDDCIEDGIPHRVRIQVAWQCECTGYPEIDVMALLGGTRPRIWTVRRDPELAAMVMGVATTFYERHIRDGHPPDIDNTETCRKYLESKYAHTVRGELMTEVPPHIDYLAQQRILAHNTEKAGKVEKDRVDNLLRDALGNAPGYKVKGAYSIGWRLGKGLERRYTFRAAKDDADE